MQVISFIMQNLGKPFSWNVWYGTIASLPVTIIFWATLSYFSATIHPDAEYKVR